MNQNLHFSLYRGVFTSVGVIYREQGVKGFFCGLIPRLLCDLAALWLGKTLAHVINNYLVEDKDLKQYVSASMNVSLWVRVRVIPQRFLISERDSEYSWVWVVIWIIWVGIALVPEYVTWLAPEYKLLQRIWLCILLTPQRPIWVTFLWVFLWTSGQVLKLVPLFCSFQFLASALTYPLQVVSNCMAVSGSG